MQKIRIKLILLFASFFSLLPGIHRAGAEQNAEVDSAQIVAEVGDTSISIHQLDSEFEKILRKEQYYFSKTERHLLRRRILEQLIDRELLLQAARRQHDLPTAAQLESFMTALRKNFSSAASFSAELEKFDLNQDSFVDEIREDLAIKNYIDRRIFAGLQVTEEDIEKAYRNSSARYSSPEEIHIYHILLKVDEKDSPEKVSEVKKRAEGIAAEARAAGVNFTLMAEKYSEAIDRNHGGDLGFFTKNQASVDFPLEAFDLALGEISAPIRTRYGFHIVKLADRRGGELESFDAIKEKVRMDVLHQKQEEALLEELRRERSTQKVLVFFR